jgi:hypothetical protein
MVKDIKERFLSNIIVKGPDDCWLWTGAISSGYGKFSIQHISYLAHRVSYMLFKGPITKDKLILHKCNIRACCNPNHLYEGTDGDNTTDKMSSCPTSLGICQTKLYESDIKQIRDIYKDGIYSLAEIGRIFKISAPTVRKVVNSTSFLCKEGKYV